MKYENEMKLKLKLKLKTIANTLELNLRNKIK